MEQVKAESPTILIVDDNPNNLQVLGKLLNEKKYKIEFTVDGQSALDWISEKQFDLILLDINMPGMSGYEVCRQIRTNREYDKLPIIFVSAENDKEAILKGFEMGGQDYITKPFDSRELIVRVNTHLSLKNSLGKLDCLNKHLEDKVRERTCQLKEAIEKLENANQKLIELDTAKMEFINLISHEIRTPLTGIIGPLQLLKVSSDTETISSMIEILDSSVNRLEVFSINALLITKLKTNPALSISNVQFEKLLTDTIEAKQDKLNRKKLEIKTVIDPDDVSLSVDADLLVPCMGIVIESAARYAPEESAIEITCIKKEGALLSKYWIMEPAFHKKFWMSLLSFSLRMKSLLITKPGLNYP